MLVSTPRHVGRRDGPDALGVLPRMGEDQSNDPTSARPQPGDRLVFLTGPKKGQAARSDDLKLGGSQAQAYPADPKGLVRDGSPLNLVVLVRVGSDGLDADTRAVGRRRGRLLRRMHASGVSG